MLLSNGVITRETPTGFPLLSVPNLDAWAPPVGCPHHVQSQFQMCDNATVFGTEYESKRKSL